MSVDRIRDHDYLISRYRGAVHCDSNLKLQVPADKRNDKITKTIVLHNCHGYDSH